MSSPSITSTVVSRSYDPAPDQCVRALELLLKQPISKEGGPPTAPKDDAKESNGCIAYPNHSR